MTTSPICYINNPTSGNQYWVDPNFWCGFVGAAGDASVQAHARAFTGTNGGGSLIAVTTFEVWVWDATASASAGHFSGGPFNAVNVNGSGILAGHIYQVSAKFTGAQTVGSFELKMDYGTSSAFIPTIPTFSPGAAGPGSHVTVSGTRFSGATIVQFNGVNAASFSVTNDTTIDAVVPSAPGVGPIMVGNPAGNSPNSAANFLPGVIERWKAGAWQPFELDVRRTGAWAYLLPQRRSTTNWNVGG
jgi:hypothetical protein